MSSVPSAGAVASHRQATFTDDRISEDSWDAPPLTYSSASSPESSPDPFISEPGFPQSRHHVQGHIPRPRNAFIIFRSYFYTQTRKQKNEDNINQNALSCAAAAAWRGLPEDGKKTFRKQAEDEKLMHYKKHPNYVYTPLNRAVKRAQKKTDKKDTKRPAKKHRSSLSQRSRKAKSLRRSTSDDSLQDNSASEFDKECCDGTKTDGESQKRVDLQFGQRPEVTFTQLPPTPTDTNSPGEPTPYSPPITLSTSSDIPAYHNSGYPDWMYNELLGYGTPDTGPHAGWNPLQTTLDSYGDNYYQPAGSDLDDFSQYVNYDNVDTTSDDYFFKETTGADAATSFPSLDYDGNFVGVQ